MIKVVPRDFFEAAVAAILAAVLLMLAMAILVTDFDRIFPATPQAMRSEEARRAASLSFASGALDRRLEAVDNPVKPAPIPVSNFLDIDQVSKKQASTRRPDKGRPPGVENLL